MAIRIFFGGIEYQRDEIDTIDPLTRWYVHSVVTESNVRRHVVEVAQFTDGLDNLISAILYAESRAMLTPHGDIWVSNTPLRPDITGIEPSR